MRYARSWFALGTLLSLAPGAWAVDVPFSGALTANDGVFNRTLAGAPPSSLSAVGTAVTYDVLPFYVTAASTYVAETLSATFAPGTADDTFLLLYQTSFNPLAPLANVLVADDDTGVGSLSSFNVVLAPATQYYLVITSFANGQLGAYTGHLNSTTGIGQVVLGAVPEVSTALMMALGLVAAGAAARAKRQS